jgi:hypothetical protein
MAVVIPHVGRLWLTPEGDVVVEYSTGGVERERERERIVRGLLESRVRSEVPPEGVPWWEFETVKLLGNGRDIIVEVRAPWVVVKRHAKEEAEVPTVLVGKVRPGLVWMSFPPHDLEVWGTDKTVEIRTLGSSLEHEPV